MAKKDKIISSNQTEELEQTYFRLHEVSCTDNEVLDEGIDFKTLWALKLWVDEIAVNWKNKQELDASCCMQAGKESKFIVPSRCPECRSEIECYTYFDGKHTRINISCCDCDWSLKV